MKTRRLTPCLLALSLWTAGLQAQTLQDWLPSQAEVAPVLQASPMLRAARARQQAQQERARGIETGPGEWSLRLEQQGRRARETPERFAETRLALERPLRLWGKASLDRELAEQERTLSRIGLADAMHEASRELMSQWFEVLRHQLEVNSAERELQLARELDQQARIRLRHGDVSALDAQLAQAERQRSEAQAHLAQAELAASTVQLQRLYPGLPLPRWPAKAGPQSRPPSPPQTTADSARQAFLEHHHGLRLLKAEAQREQLLAERQVRDRWPDPTVGLFGARERGGQEQVLGLSVSVPLAGRYRDSQARSALAQAQAMAEGVVQLERELSADFDGRWQRLTLQLQALEGLRAAAHTQRLAAEKSQTAYTLGEHTMTELIQNRRLAHEQQLASERLQLQALLNQALLELDAHRLWDLDD